MLDALYQLILNAVYYVESAGWAAVLQFWAYLVDWFGDLLGQVWAFAESVLPAGWVAFLNQRPWDAYFSYVDLVDYFTGAYAILGIWATAFAFAAGIRGVRWLLAVIPRAFTGLS